MFFFYNIIHSNEQKTIKSLCGHPLYSLTQCEVVLLALLYHSLKWLYFHLRERLAMMEGKTQMCNLDFTILFVMEVYHEGSVCLMYSVLDLLSHL